VISVGDSRDEVELLTHEAIEFHLEGMREEGMAIPSPSSFAGVVEERRALIAANCLFAPRGSPQLDLNGATSSMANSACTGIYQHPSSV